MVKYVGWKEWINHSFFLYSERRLKMTERQKRFCEEYIASGNATQSAIKAGYSPNSAKQVGQRLLTYADLKSYIDKNLSEISSSKIATAQEVLEYLTSVLRGESTSTEVVVEGIGEGCSEARLIKKAPSEKERLKAGELLGKRYGIYTEKVDMNVQTPVFGGEEDLED